MVKVDKNKLEQYVKEIEAIPELQGCKRFVENFFGTVGKLELEYAYVNYLRDILMYAPTNRAIDQNKTYLCWVFKEVTGVEAEELADIEYKYFGPTDVWVF